MSKNFFKNKVVFACSIIITAGFICVMILIVVALVTVNL